MIYLYVLRSLTDYGYYIGISKDPENRFRKHNKGDIRSTRKRKSFEIIHLEMFDNYSQARVREKEIKSYKGGNKFKELLN